jgi:hypothetical protein
MASTVRNATGFSSTLTQKHVVLGFGILALRQMQAQRAAGARIQRNLALLASFALAHLQPAGAFPQVQIAQPQGAHFARA